MSNTIAIAGGGLAGLAAAIRLAERGYGVSLFEAAPELGGRTRSWFDTERQQWIDHGPHLLIGAYHRTRQLLQDTGAQSTIHWQPHLQLALWDHERGLFTLRPSPRLPLAMGLPLALARLPGHGAASAVAMSRLGLMLRGRPHGNVATLMQQARIVPAMQRDLIEPLCQGSMNAPMHEADAASFAEVLRQSFASHSHARLGWFTAPLQQALIQPLAEYALRLGVQIHIRTRLRGIRADDGGATLDLTQGQRRFRRVVLALPPLARNRLLGLQQPLQSRPITNQHLWLADMPPLAYPLIGGIGTRGQWFFDVSAQMGEPADGADTPRHICVVISADSENVDATERRQQLLSELQAISGTHPSQLVRHRSVQVRHATTLVSDTPTAQLPASLIDACEQPQPGELPATIESAIQRGEAAARHIILAG